MLDRHREKSVRIRSYSDPHFPAFGLITERYSEKVSYSELFWSAFSRIRTEYGEILRILRITPYSLRMRENADRNNSEYGHVFRVSLRIQSKYEGSVRVLNIPMKLGLIRIQHKISGRLFYIQS